MRIIGGVHRGRALLGPNDPLPDGHMRQRRGISTKVRPTADRTREALFDILLHADRPFAGQRVLDAFCGSGAVALEALSRGASHATGFEIDAAVRACAAANARALGLESRFDLRAIDATRPHRAAAPVDFIYLDPPYDAGLLPVALTALVAECWIGAHTQVVCETAARGTDVAFIKALNHADEGLTGPFGRLTLYDHRRYGAAQLWFLRVLGE